MIKVYLQMITSLADPKEDMSLLSGIPEWRQKKILSYAHPGDRKLCYGAWKLLERAFSSCDAATHQVTIGENGKPVCPGVNFNLSHSEDAVLCVVSDGDTPIGCDIEKIGTAPAKTAGRYFSQKEQEYVASALTDDERNRRFFKLWTMKESYLKMTGEGMNCSPRRIEVDLDSLTVFRDGQPQNCRLRNFTAEQYEISVCFFDESEIYFSINLNKK
jgi:4'-phosphopantetheinyl transferase